MDITKLLSERLHELTFLSTVPGSTHSAHPRPTLISSSKGQCRGWAICNFLLLSELHIFHINFNVFCYELPFRVNCFVLLCILERGKGGRKRGRATSMCGCLSHAPYWGPCLQPRHVPWLGIETATLWFSGQHSIHWATPARAVIKGFLMSNVFLIFFLVISCNPFVFHIIRSDRCVPVFSTCYKGQDSPQFFPFK